MKQKAIIIDLDGTFVCDPAASSAVFTNAESMDWDAWHETRRYLPRNQWCYEIIKQFAIAGHTIIYLTGREGTDKGFEVAKHWLQMHSPVPNYVLLMREKGDNGTPDYIVKEKIYDKHVRGVYDVVFAIDDKRDVYNLWKKIGIGSLYCGDID